ncbi:MAG: alpha/beta hydrolase [Ilumatobacteraceae bacterium]
MQARPVAVAIVVGGCSMAVIVGGDGSPGWTVIRLGAIAAVTAVALVVTSEPWRSTVRIVIGTVGMVAGLGIGVVHLVRSGDLALAVAGLAALGSGLVLVVDGVGGAVRGRGRWTRAAGIGAAVLAVAAACLAFVPAVMATNVPRPVLGAVTPARFGVEYRDVEFDTEDAVRIAGWYIPSSNGAAVVLRHGSGSTRSDVVAQAATISRGGYGVLLTDARGHGQSGGRAMDFGWYGDADTRAAVTFLTEQPDVDPDRIGVVGMSMGGEEAIGAAAADPRIGAVVAEGATGRTDGDMGWLSDVYGVRGTLQEGIEWLRFALADGLTAAHKPMSLAEAISTASSTEFFLIAGGAVADERHVLNRLSTSEPANLTTWIVPDAGHVQGLDREPAEWADRVLSFLDVALSGGVP